ncbi:MAG: hypothetical protein ACREBJ_08590, partial [Nitrosotalea sp.]
MVSSAIGIDSVTFYRTGKTATFKAPLGVAVEVENYDNFNLKYQKLMSDLKSQYHLETDRLCLKGHYVYGKIKDKAYEFINDFVSNIIPSLKMIYVCHTVVSIDQVPEIFCCNGTQKIPTLD